MRRRTVLPVAAAGLLFVAGCGSGSHKDTTPLSTAAPKSPQFCGFLSRDAVVTATGATHDVGADGAVHQYPTDQRNADGGRMQAAYCQVLSGSKEVMSVSVTPVGWRTDLDQQVVSIAAGSDTHAFKPQYVFPADYATGYAVQEPESTGGEVDVLANVLRGNWNVRVAESRIAEGRNAVADVEAITRQIIAYLQLPAAHAKPYPSPSS